MQKQILANSGGNDITNNVHCTLKKQQQGGLEQKYACNHVSWCALDVFSGHKNKSCCTIS